MITAISDEAGGKTRLFLMGKKGWRIFEGLVKRENMKNNVSSFWIRREYSFDLLFSEK